MRPIPSGPPDVEVSIAHTDAERMRCFALRYRVYVEEQGRQLPFADHERGIDQNGDDPRGIVLQATAGGEVVGTVRVHHGAETGMPRFVGDVFDLPSLMEEAPWTEMATVTRLAVDARHRGGQATVALLRACFDFLKSSERGTRMILITAVDEPRLVAMYRLLGFHPVGSGPWYMAELGPSTPMIARLGNRADSLPGAR